MKLKNYLDSPEEIFIGAVLQFPLYFIVGWSVIPLSVICGLLWRLGGVSKGNKLFRRLGVPLLVCFSTFMCSKNQWIFLAVPFMVWLAPSYGKESWIFKLVKNDFLVRMICICWYWTAFSIAYCF
jgi:hypothetical protein